MLKLSIIIINYGTPLYTINCIKSLCQHYKKELKLSEFEIILVDNKSLDDSVIKLEKEIKKKGWKINLIKSNKNTGFGGGCNLGAKRSKGKYLLFLNSDTVSRDRSINRMINFMDQHKKVGILGGGLFNQDGTSPAGGGVFPNFFRSLMIFFGLGKNILVKNVKTISKIEWAGGGCMMVNKRVFNRLEGFDENMFMYMEDIEISYRAHLYNFDIYYFPETNILHLKGQSSNDSFRTINSYKGYLYFYKKHKNKAEFLLINFLFKLKFKIYFICGRLVNNTHLVETYKQII